MSGTQYMFHKLLLNEKIIEHLKLYCLFQLAKELGKIIKPENKTDERNTTGGAANTFFRGSFQKPQVGKVPPTPHIVYTNLLVCLPSEVGVC